MSKLLQKLDQAIQTNFDGVKEAVMDKQYMGQLVAVQHQRGAQGGHVFANLLGKYVLFKVTFAGFSKCFPFSEIWLLGSIISNLSIPWISIWYISYAKARGKKNSYNQINQFHEICFDQIPFFAMSKMAKNQFLNWKKFWNCQNCNFT